MKRNAILISMFLVLVMRQPLRAAEPNPLQPLEFLTGSCWKGTFPDGKVTDTHCFEWVYGDKFVRDRHHTEGADAPYGGETLYAWDAKEKIVRYTYWNTLGAVITGSMSVGTDGTLNFPEHYVQAGKTIEMNNVWKRTGPDTYEVLVTRKKEGTWTELWRMTLNRLPEAAQP